MKKSFILMIFILEDDHMMAECIARSCGKVPTKIFPDGIAAMNALNDEIPDLIFLDVLLSGPDGFTFLNELVSYSDTANIPVVIISSLNLENKDLSDYGVVGILNKDKMLPQEIKKYVERFTH